MSKNPFSPLDSSPQELSDQELLKRIAALDPDEFPLATYAQAALDNFESGEVTQEESS